MFRYAKKLIKYLKPIPIYKEIPIIDNDDQDMSGEDLPLINKSPGMLRKHTGFAFSGEPGYTPQIPDPKYYGENK